MVCSVLVYRSVVAGGVIANSQQTGIVPNDKMWRGKNVPVPMLHNLSKMELFVANRRVSLFPTHARSVGWIEHRPINVVVAWDKDDFVERYPHGICRL
jgi:hypothetical protein